ncbi:MAG: bifunctional nicotinamidase/pyrazinamidase [Treponema sp.]|jgi:nicotinamidase/pyrazinamidase|nr:bifunctional nicotinamidase/pyrazinamidase [Treponema sp.]
MFIDYTKSALIIVDMQNDFCPAYTNKRGEKTPRGALAVDGGAEICAPLNALSKRFAQNGGKVVATKDWHPKGHMSFVSSFPGKKFGDTVDFGITKGQVLWPDHCVQGTPGADFHEGLNIESINLVIHKGYRVDLDAYSTFFENDRQTSTGLDGYLRSLLITDIFIGGLATDYCVLYSALDGLRLRYKTFVLTDATRGVEHPAGSTQHSLNVMKVSGINLITSQDVLNEEYKE